jgi:hypothetical protein
MTRAWWCGGTATAAITSCLSSTAVRGSAATGAWRFGAAFGPIIAGNEGARFLEITNGDFRSWGDQPETYDEAVAAHGVTPLPDPPIDLGRWFEDKRGYWAPNEETARS